MPSGGGGGGGSRIRGGRSGGSLGESGGVGTSAVSGDNCAPVYRGAGLASPKSAVISKLKVNDTLELDAQPQGPFYVLYAVKSGARAGVVTHKLIDKIIGCIVEGGHKYVGLVTALQGGSCTLEIRMES